MKHVLLMATLLLVSYQSAVVDLNRKNYEATIAANPYILVEFYSPHCEHCKKLAPKLEKAAQQLQEQNIVVAKVDANEEKVLAARLKVRGFPTLFFYRGGLRQLYTGGRTTEAIVEWVTANAKPLLNIFETEYDFNLFEKENAARVIYFESEGLQTDNKFLQLFADLKVEFSQFAFAYVKQPQLRQIHELGPDQNLISVFHEEKSVFDGRLGSYDDLKYFIESQIYPLVQKFTPQQHQRNLEKVKHAIFFWESEATSAFTDTFQRAALNYKRKHQFVVVQSTDVGAEQRFISLLQAVGVSNGAVYIVDFHSQNRYKLDGELTIENLQAFIAAFEENTLTPLDIVPVVFDGTVANITSQDFDFIVRSSPYDVLVEFYAPWCGHCKALAPVYDELAKKVEPLKQLLIAKVDSPANPIPGIKIEGYPTLLYFKKQPSQGVKQVEGRTLAQLVAGIKEHYSFEWVDIGEIPVDAQAASESEESTDGVKVITQANFQELVQNSPQDVLLEFYAPWCGHCKQLAPTYAQLAAKVAGNPNVIIAKVDATQHKFPDLGIQGFPTIKFFKKGDNARVIDYTGPRSLVGFEAFLKENASQPWPADPKVEDL